MNSPISTREAYGDTLVTLGKTYPNLIVLDADLSKATFTNKFAKQFPNRFFNTGIAEANMIGIAAGLSTCDKIPFTNTFAIFNGRCFEQIRNSVCYPNLNVKIIGTHAGISVGEDGATHQAIEDIAIMRSLPNISIFTPSDGIQTKWTIEEAIKRSGPFYIRLGRPSLPIIYNENCHFEFGKAHILNEGTDITIISCGLMTHYSIEATKILNSLGISVRLLDMHTIKPLDEQTIIESAKITKCILTVEEHSIIGGLGESVASTLSRNIPTKLKMIGINDCFGTSGKWKDVLNKYNLTTENIVQTAKSMIN